LCTYGFAIYLKQNLTDLQESWFEYNYFILPEDYRYWSFCQEAILVLTFDKNFLKEESNRKDVFHFLNIVQISELILSFKTDELSPEPTKKDVTDTFKKLRKNESLNSEEIHPKIVIDFNHIIEGQYPALIKWVEITDSEESPY